MTTLLEQRNIKLTNTNANSYQCSSVSVLKNGQRVARVEMGAIRNPLNYLISRNHSKYILELHNQLIDAMHNDTITHDDLSAVCDEVLYRYTTS